MMSTTSNKPINRENLKRALARICRELMYLRSKNQTNISNFHIKTAESYLMKAIKK